MTTPRHVVLVAGGRSYWHRELIERTLSELHSRTPITLLVHGAAPGADTVAARWAVKAGVPQKAYPAAWERLGRRAGPIRNQQMLDESEPDRAVFFAGGAGTRDNRQRCRAAHVPCIVDVPDDGYLARQASGRGVTAADVEQEVADRQGRRP